MIKLENVGLASPEQMEFIIEGMRNPMNSWEKSDVLELVVLKITNEKWADRIHFVQFNSEYGAKENIIKIERKI